MAGKTLPLLTNCLANTYNSTMYHITPKHDYAIHIISDQRFTFIANLFSHSIRKTLQNPYINSWVTEFVNKVCVIQKRPLAVHSHITDIHIHLRCTNELHFVVSGLPTIYYINNSSAANIISSFQHKILKRWPIKDISMHCNGSQLLAEETRCISEGPF